MDRKLLQFLGLCQRAGKMVSGETSVSGAIKDGSAELVIVAQNASDNTKKKFSDSAAYYNRNIVFFGDKFELGKAIGKDERAVIAVIDNGFAKKIVEMVG
ncbi:putative ribosomal protein YlxQ [Clostridiales bacterium]|nr:putative ribosomal protein YlxQ [Clostridiales bacterium]